MNANKTIITFKKTMTVELSFEDFFSRFYDVGQEEEANKVWAKMGDLKTESEGYGDYDDLAPEIDLIKETAEEELAAEEQNDNGVACEKCEKTTCEEDEQFNERILWTSTETGKNICRACVGVEQN